jgi:transposase
MRGENEKQAGMFCYTSCEDRVPATHPLRRVKKLADQALANLSPQFDEMYSDVGRPSVPPERLLKAQLLMALYTVRSDRLFCEELNYHFLFRWFLDMDVEEPVFDASTFSQNRERLMDSAIAHQFLNEVVTLARAKNLLSDEHFTTDGTLIEAWASLKSFVPKDGKKPKKTDDDPGNPTVNFRGEKRGNQTHQSTTDPDSRLMRKSAGTTAKLSYCGTVLMENRHGLCVDVDAAPATGQAERELAERLIAKEKRRGKGRFRTLGGDKGFCVKDFVARLRRKGIIPHIARKEKCTTPGLDGRTTRHETFRVSQRIRKRVEEIFGWLKTVGGWRKLRLRGLRRVREFIYMTIAAYNLLRMGKLIPG